MTRKAHIDEFMQLAAHCLVIDVRSPGEFAHAHIPGAYSLPLFTDEERKIVGTAYKQVSREEAIKIGLDYFGVKMRAMVEEVEGVLNKYHQGRQERNVLVHCWRGGMRSAGVAWLLDLYGFKVTTLEGGYKAFRNWVLAQLEFPRQLNVLGGYTGSGKTKILEDLEQAGHKTVDLEDLAQHKGSAFGGYGMVQPSQEMFENKLALCMHRLEAAHNEKSPFWIEDESQRIGSVIVPATFWKQMRASCLYFVNVPFEERLKYIADDYGKQPIEELIDATKRISKRLGGLETKNALNFLQERNFTDAFRILLKYYDKCYLKGLEERNKMNLPIVKIDMEYPGAAFNFHGLTEECRITNNNTQNI